MQHSTSALPAIISSRTEAEIAFVGFLGRFHGATLKLYEYHLKEYLKWCAGHGLDPLRDIKRVHVELYVRHLVEEKGLKPSTVGTRMSPVKGFYKFAVIDEIILRNPAEYVALPKITYQKAPLVPYRDLMLWLRGNLSRPACMPSFRACRASVSRPGSGARLPAADPGRPMKKKWPGTVTLRRRQAESPSRTRRLGV